jgi:hypothetical protein
VAACWSYGGEQHCLAGIHRQGNSCEVVMDFSTGPCVVGMTYRAYHGPSNMPAHVPGVPTALAREDRLRPKGRLRQQPAGDSTEENQSRAMKTKLPNGCLAESRLAPTGATKAKDGVTTAMIGLSQSEIEDPSPRRDPRQKGGDMPPRCRSGEKALYKVPLLEQGQRMTPRTPPLRSRQPAESLPNL